MTLPTFDEFVNEQIDMSKGQNLQVDRKRELNEWKMYLEKFFEIVEKTLDEYIKDGRVKAKYSKKLINEEYVGTYEAKTLRITIGSKEVFFNPVGMRVIAAKGRVDMMGTHGTVKCLLVPNDLAKLGMWTIESFDGMNSDGEPNTQSRMQVSVDDDSTRGEKRSDENLVWKIATSPPNIRLIEIDESALRFAIMGISNA